MCNSSTKFLCNTVLNGTISLWLSEVESRLWVFIYSSIRGIYHNSSSLSIEWNLIRLGGTTHGILTKTVHKTLPGVQGIKGV